MSTVYIIVGCAGAGKSTWAKNMVKNHKDTFIVNKDSLRTMINGEYLYKEELELMIVKMSISCLNDLNDGEKNVIIDETNLTKEYRNQWLQHCSSFDRKVFVWFPETEKNLDRRMNEPRGCSRDRWQEVIDNMKKIFEMPTLDEGVDDIITVTDTGEQSVIGDVCRITGCSGLNQSCPTCNCEIIKKYFRFFKGLIK